MLGELIPLGGGAPIPLYAGGVSESGSSRCRLVVGRDTRCDITLPFSTVSSKHCVLEWRDGCWFVEDLGSRNGTRINGVRCQSTAFLPQDVLAIAQHRFGISYEPSTTGRGHETGPSSPAAAVGGDRASGESPEAGPSSPGPMSGPPSGGLLGELDPCGGGDPIPLLKPKLVLGRRSSCDITLRFPTVSSRHCTLEFNDGYWFVKDLGSRNGTRVNGVRCQSKWLFPDDILSISKHRYSIVFEPQGEGPPPEEDPFGQSLLEKAGLASRDIERLPAEDDEPSRPRWNLHD